MVDMGYFKSCEERLESIPKFKMLAKTSCATRIFINLRTIDTETLKPMTKSMDGSKGLNNVVALTTIIFY